MRELLSSSKEPQLKITQSDESLSVKIIPYHLLISKSLFKKLITPAMFECEKRGIAHSKALFLVQFHCFKRNKLGKSQKTVLRRREIFFEFFFENVLGNTWGSFTQNFSQIQYVDPICIVVAPSTYSRVLTLLFWYNELQKIRKHPGRP